MALPYLLVAAAPGIARLLPRPGAWMETVRGVMGFLLAAAAVWLFYVLSSQVSPEQLAAIQLGLLGIALFTWIQHRVASSRGLRGAGRGGHRGGDRHHDGLRRPRSCGEAGGAGRPPSRRA